VLSSPLVTAMMMFGWSCLEVPLEDLKTLQTASTFFKLRRKKIVRLTQTIVSWILINGQKKKYVFHITGKI
jgi:hypothetical protein